MAEISPSACRYSTILLLWVGSTRAKRRAMREALACSVGDNSSNSRPVYDFPSVDSDSLKTPIRRQIASAVAYAHDNTAKTHLCHVQYQRKTANAEFECKYTVLHLARYITSCFQKESFQTITCTDKKGTAEMSTDPKRPRCVIDFRVSSIINQINKQIYKALP